MSGRLDKAAQQIKALVDHPFTQLAKGLILLMIGLAEVSQTFRDDLTHGHVRVGHGLIIIGLFGVLGCLPQLLDGLESGARYLEQRGKKAGLREREGSP